MTDDMHPRVRRQAAIASFTLFALQSRDISATIARSISTVLETLPAPAGALVRAQAPGRSDVVHSQGPIADACGDELDPGPDHPSARAASPPTASDEGQDHGPARTLSPQAGRLRAGVSAAVPVEGRTWGLLLVSDVVPRDFTPTEAAFVQAIAEVLGAALEHERIGTRHTALADFARFALECPDVALSIERAVEVLPKVIDAPLGAAIRVSRRPATLKIVHSTGPVGRPDGDEFDVDPALATALITPDLLIIEDLPGDGRFATSLLPPSTPSVAALAAAVRIGDRVWGRLVVSDSRPRQFSAAEVHALTSMANMLAAALERKRLEWSRAGADRLSAARRQAGPDQPGSTTEVALLDREGVIVWVNRVWQDFCRDNAGDPARSGVGVSYLTCCDAADDPTAAQVATAIRAAVRGELPAPMTIMIPCHSPQAARWFDLLISTRLDDDGRCLGAAVTLSPAML